MQNHGCLLICLYQNDRGPICRTTDSLHIAIGVACVSPAWQSLTLHAGRCAGASHHLEIPGKTAPGGPA